MAYRPNRFRSACRLPNEQSSFTSTRFFASWARTIARKPWLWRRNADSCEASALLPGPFFGDRGHDQLPHQFSRNRLVERETQRALRLAKAAQLVGQGNRRGPVDGAVALGRTEGHKACTEFV